VNVEHLLNAFTTIDATPGGVWGICRNFMIHLFWHKARLVILGPKIEALADDHPSKPECLFRLSQLFYKVGSYAECKRLLTHALKLSREQRDDHQLAQMLGELSLVNFWGCSSKEGIQQAKEASEIYGQLGGTVEQAASLAFLAQFLLGDNQLAAAEEATSRAIDLLQGREEQFLVCHRHQVLGIIYH